MKEIPVLDGLSEEFIEAARVLCAKRSGMSDGDFEVAARELGRAHGVDTDRLWDVLPEIEEAAGIGNRHG